MIRSAPARVIRARRYVSAPAGSYPAPVPIGSGPVPGAQAVPRVPEPAAPPGGVEPSAPTSPPAGALTRAAPPVARGATAGRSLAGRLLAMLAGGIFGGTLGVAVGAALLALQDAPRWLERLSDPRALWASANDPIVVGSVAAVVAGFTLIGLLWPLRRG